MSDRIPDFNLRDRVRVMNTDWAQANNLVGKTGSIIMVIGPAYGGDTIFEVMLDDGGSTEINASQLVHER